MLSSSIFLILISGLGVLHGLFLAVFLWVYKNGNASANKILSVLLIILSIRVGKSVLLEFAENLDLKIIFMGLAMMMVIGPLFFFYTKAILDKTFHFQSKHLVHFLPALLGVTFGAWLDESKTSTLPMVIFLVIFVGYYGHYLTYLFMSYSRVSKAKKNNNLRPSTYSLLRLLFYGLLVIWVAYVLNLFDEFIPYIVGPILYTLVAYTVSFIVIQKGYMLETDATKYKTNPISDEQAEQLFTKVMKMVVEEKQYKNANLSLKFLSEKLNVSTQILSLVINQQNKTNFNSFINHHRIKESIAMFQDEHLQNHTIASIAFDVGFNSLSSFNSAFKNEHGIAPKTFRKNLSE